MEEQVLEAAGYFAKTFWDEEGFGPLLIDENTKGAISFWLAAYRLACNLAARQIVELHNFTISASEAMGL
ncbi:MAG: hypothetical protein P8O03_03010 [Ilumatobacter sp.]|nr:hypothetical protein [Ilumatobacter sp.]